MPDVAWAFSGLPQADPGGRVTPRFSHRLIRFRHFNSGSLALASLNHACWDHVPTFPQRSPPSLLTTAACGSLRSAPDCRTRRALLHLPYSCALPCGRAMLVTQDPKADMRRPLLLRCTGLICYTWPVISGLGLRPHEATRVHNPSSGRLATRGARAAARAHAAHRRPHGLHRERSASINPQCRFAGGTAAIGLDC